MNTTIQENTDIKEAKWYQSKWWPMILITVGCVAFLLIAKWLMNMMN